ncbi:MAG: hypothetical protein K2X01_02620 [Cyanobacteria bacterium]|nr:hypothetical protein [Cyanobacteriota bacterium]
MSKEMLESDTTATQSSLRKPQGLLLAHIKSHLAALFHQKTVDKMDAEVLVQSFSTLESVNKELTRCYRDVRKAKTGSDNEERLIGRIRHLEDRRFKMLGDLNGSDLAGYNMR